jgi:hypothetical protein
MDTTQQHNEGSDLAGDLLVGWDAIHDFLVHLGLPETTDPYHLKRRGNWPIGKTSGEGGHLIASKRRLTRHAQKITAPTAA